MSNKKQPEWPHDIKEKIMKDIKNKRIKIKSPFIFMAQKLGLESALATTIIAGALLVSVIFYFLKKTGILKFLNLGVAGLKIFILSLPYDFIALFIITIILAIYLANKIKLSRGQYLRADFFAVYFFLITLALGLFFGIMGVGRFSKNWIKNTLPRDEAIQGRIKVFSNKKVVIEDDNGNTANVFINELNPARLKINYVPGKILRAIGWRDKQDDNLFHAQKIRCCDDN